MIGALITPQSKDEEPSMSVLIQLPQHFNFDDLVNEARAGRFNPEAFVQSVALDMSQTQFVGIGAAVCLKALALRFQDGLPEGECLAMRHGGQDCISYLWSAPRV